MIYSRGKEPDVLIDGQLIVKRFRLGQYISPHAILNEFLKRVLPVNMRPKFINEVAKKFPLLTALDEVSITVRRGERVGLVGLNGAGKTTLLKILSGIMMPDSGSVKSDCRVVPLLGLGASFNPEMSGHENIILYANILGLTAKEIDEAYPKIVEFSGLRDFLHTPFKRYSKGMKARLGMGVAFHVKPDVLIIDEVLAVGDIPFREKCMHKIHEVTAAGVALIFVSHSVARILATTDRCIVLRRGRVVKDGPTPETLDFYKQNDLAEVGLQETDIDDEEVMNEKPLVWRQDFKLDPTKGISLRTVSIAGSLSGNAEEFHLDEGIEVNLSFSLSSKTLIVYPRVKLYDHSGEFLFSMTWPDGTEGVSSDGDTTEFNASLKVPESFLNSGVYSIGVGLYSYTPMKKHINLVTDVRFKILNKRAVPTNPEYTSSLKRLGICTPQFEWSIEPKHASLSRSPLVEN